MRRLARAKVNLYLHVVGRRPDGYHELDSLVAFASVADQLEAAPAARLSLEVDGPFASEVPPGEENLVLRAAAALARAAGVKAGAALRLTKNLPVAAGLGGGSSDAAACLQLLRELWGVALPPERMAEIALELGADVPACLFGLPCFVGGIGERLEAAPRLPEVGLLLANPGVPLPTQSVFRRFNGPFTLSSRFIEAPTDAVELAKLLKERRNDLEAAAREIAPEIAAALSRLAALPGALLARMSGSGATCFAIFSSTAEARRAADLLMKAESSWWTAAGCLEGGTCVTGPTSP